MKNNLPYTILFLLFLMAFFTKAHARWDEITLNGITQNRAMFTINGAYTIIEQGMTKHGFRLLSVNRDGVMVEHNGQKKYLSLSISKNSSLFQKGVITNTNPLKHQRTKSTQANSHFIAVSPVDVQSDSTTFNVVYYYNGNHGESGQIRARTRYRGKDTGFSSHSYVQLKSGRNQVAVQVMMSDSAPNTYQSDEVLFDIVGSRSVSGSHLVTSYKLPYAMTWYKEKNKPEQFIIGSPKVWRTGKQ